MYVDVRYPKSIPCTVRVNIFILAIDPLHWYLNESESTDQDIYDDFKLKKTFGLHNLYVFQHCKCLVITLVVPGRKTKHIWSV